MSASEALPRRGRALRTRYTVADLGALTGDEASRFVGPGADPQIDLELAWELLYRLEPQLYDRLIAAEHLHPGILRWLPRNVDRIVEIGAGTGRLTLELLSRGHELIAIEPAAPMRELLNRKLAPANHGCRVRVSAGFFDDLPIADDWAELVVACSAFTPAPGHGGDAGLTEMERVCRPGGRVVIVWPNDIGWLSARGYRYVRFDGGETFLEFASDDEAAELIEIFYPHASAQVRRDRLRRVGFETVGLNPPRDLAYKVIAR